MEKQPYEDVKLINGQNQKKKDEASGCNPNQAGYTKPSSLFYKCSPFFFQEAQTLPSLLPRLSAASLLILCQLFSQITTQN